MNIYTLLNELDSFNLPKGQYAITSSGVLAIRGIREAQDLDVLVTQKLLKELEVKYPKAKFGIEIGNIHFFSDSENSSDKGPTAKEQIDQAEMINGYPFVKLETVKYFKTLWGREKDKKDLELIEGYMQELDKTTIIQ